MCSKCSKALKVVEQINSELNSGWKHSDEVVTTYGSIQLSIEQAYTAGVKAEQERIIKLLEEQDICDFCEIIALIKGESNE